MSDLLSHVTTQENLCWAWLKAKRMYESDDGLCDDLEVADFEMKLKDSLTSIAEDLTRGRYQLRPFVPLAHPKGNDDSQNHRIRPYFKVSVRDQVAWVALVNIIGPTVEECMPLWSYGNRLYRQMFFEPAAQGRKHLRFGHFRHAKGQLYRPFHQAWPVYRRHILFTARKMTGDKIVLDDRDNELLKMEMELETRRLPYLLAGWWKRSHREAFWGTVDFRQFYPNISLEVLRSNLCRYCGYAEDDIASVLDQLLFFPLGKCDWPNADLEMVGLSAAQKRINGLPTGLFVSGFLANAAMLAIDHAVDERLLSRQIAQFRYVDDHTVLAPSYEALEKWLDEYLSIVKDAGLAVEINENKTEPEALRNYRMCLHKSGPEFEELERKAKNATRIDIRLPAPFLTRTLAKVSMIARVEIDLQTLDEQDALLADIEQLLLTEFPPEELRPDTRMSFAMSQLCKVASRRFPHSKETWKVEEEIAALIDSHKGKERSESSELRKLQSNRDHAIENHFSHLFQFLEMTLERFPDRPRLWAKALRFCLLTGYAPGLEKIFGLLRQTDGLHDLSKEYMAFFMLQRINRYFLQAVSAILSPDRPLCQRSAAVRFANACYELAEQTPCAQREHSNVVRIYSECRSMYWLLSRCVRSRRRAAYDLEEVYIFLYQQGLLTTLPSAEKTIPNLIEKQQGDEAAHWHVDGIITAFIATRPSFYWWSIAPGLVPHRRGDFLLLAKWPRFLTARARKQCLRNLIVAASGRLGWFAEIAAGISDGAVPTELRGAKRLILSSKYSLKYVTLNDWVRYVRDLDVWDPRRSEWTALEVVRQALAIRLSFSARDQKRVPLIPQNILVPMVWRNSPPRQSFHTWESWERDSRAPKSPVRLRSSRPIGDDRYSPLWQNPKIPPEPWEDVYACGLVLLGMLRLSFDLPCSWNPEGQARLWSKGMGRILTELPCSSWTLAILQATILPRNRETFVLRSLDQARFYQDDDDTVNDPPEIHNLDLLKKLLEQSQGILRRHRVTVQNHRPRQLVPLSLDQIGKALFEGATGGE